MLEKMFKLTTENGSYFIVKDHEDFPSQWISVEKFIGENLQSKFSIHKCDAKHLAKALLELAEEK